MQKHHFSVKLSIFSHNQALATIRVVALNSVEQVVDLVQNSIPSLAFGGRNSQSTF